MSVAPKWEGKSFSTLKIVQEIKHFTKDKKNQPCETGTPPELTWRYAEASALPKTKKNFIYRMKNRIYKFLKHADK